MLFSDLTDLDSPTLGSVSAFIRMPTLILKEKHPSKAIAMFKHKHNRDGNGLERGYGNAKSGQVQFGTRAKPFSTPVETPFPSHSHSSPHLS